MIHPTGPYDIPLGIDSAPYLPPVETNAIRPSKNELDG